MFRIKFSTWLCSFAVLGALTACHVTPLHKVQNPGALQQKVAFTVAGSFTENQQLQRALQKRLGQAGEHAPYRLQVSLDRLVRNNLSVRRTGDRSSDGVVLRASFSLHISGVKKPALVGVSQVRSSYSVLRSHFNNDMLESHKLDVLMGQLVDDILGRVRVKLAMMPDEGR